MSRRGQALIFVILFLVPMVLAWGLALRTNHAVVLKIRVQNAVDAATTECGAHVSRVMNQIAVHNMAILKYHALVAATRAAIKGADKALQYAQQELQTAQQHLTCWQGELSTQMGCCPQACMIPFPPCDGLNCGECTQYIKDLNTCIQCMTSNVIPTWNKIISFWNTEKQFLEQQKQQFEGTVKPKVQAMGQKSTTMLNEMDQKLKEICRSVAARHGLDETKANQDGWIYCGADGAPLTPGQFQTSKFLKKTQVSDLAGIAMEAKGTGSTGPVGDLVQGIVLYEGPPTKLGKNITDKDGKDRSQTPADWGSTNYILEYIYCVHFGLPGYFTYRTMHGPIGNPDSRSDGKNCGGQQHEGCEKPNKTYQHQRMSERCGASQQSPCNKDDKDYDYTRDKAHEEAEKVKKQENDSEFGSGQEDVYFLEATPYLVWVFCSKFRAYQGFFQKLFPAKTIDTGDGFTPRGGPNDFLYALSKFELYNLNETDGKILGRNEYNQYPKNLLTQDWHALMAPIFPDERGDPRSTVAQQMNQNMNH